MRRLFVAVVLGVLCAARMASAEANVEAEEKKAPFEHVVPFTTTGGFFGFFNQADGKVYLYDAQLERLVLEAQITELGQPPKTVRSSFSDQSQDRLQYKK